MKKLIFTVFISLLSMQMFSQEHSVSGKVTDEGDGTALPGVSILIKGTTEGVSTDFDGNYTLDVTNNDAVLVFSFIGFSEQEISIGAESVVNVQMIQDATALTEVIVTALGIEREKKELVYSAQAIKGELLEGAKEINVANYLTGHIAGVQVSNSSAGSGGSTNVTIRGNSSLTGSNQPLYVVDGVPLINETNSSPGAGLWGDNDYGDGIGSINPDDVESMTVLKGPSASALYGSRGANGVILITTKSGKSQRGIGVEFNSTTSIETLNLFPNVQNKYATGYEGTNIYGGNSTIDGVTLENLPAWHGDSWGPPLDGRRVVWNPFLLPGEEKTPLTLLPQDKNNVRDFYETGIVSSNMLSFSGGGEKTTARLSIGNTYNKGIIPNSSGNRNTVSLRVNSKLTDKLSFDAKVNYTNIEWDNRPYLGSSGNNITYQLAILGRYVDMDFLKEYYEETGRSTRWAGVRLGNPYYTVNELNNNDKRNRMTGFFSLRYEFTDWLNLSIRSGLDWYTDERKKIWPVGAVWPNGSGRFEESNINTREWNSDFLLTASGELSSNFTGTFSVGGNLLKQYSSAMSWDASNLKAPGVYNISNAQEVEPEQSLREKEVQSLYFLGQLAYKDYLFLDVTGRNDWSSTLAADNYSFFYPSVGLSFVFTDAFDIDSDIISFGKIRASWAQVGNDSSPYLTKAGYSSYTTSYNGQGYASVYTALPAVDLRNELTESIEFGIDVQMFKNRIGLDLVYYDGNTKDQILPVQISSGSGFQRAVINAGEVRNKGYEITFNAGIFRKRDGFNWNLSFNYAKNSSEVVELVPGIESLLLVDHYPNDIEARIGEPFGNIIGYKYKRSLEDGRRIVGSGGGYQREADKSVLGNINPDWVGGLNNAFSYKGLFMNVLVDFVQGGELSSSTKYQMTAKGTGAFTEEGRRPQDTDDSGAQLPFVGVLDGVVEVLDSNGEVTGYEENTKAVDGQTYWANRAWSGIGEEFVLDASYIMLREVTIGYNINPDVLKNSAFNGIRVSLIGRNLFYFEEHMEDMGISPESAPNTAPGARGIETLSMPTTRSWGINLNLTF